MTAPDGGKGGRPPGLPKTGGRKRGTPNRSTLLLREKLAQLNCDPIIELVNIARDPQTEVGQRAHIYSSLIRYTCPLPKPVSVDDEEISDTPEITLDDALAWARYLIDKFDPAREQANSELPDQEPDPNHQEDPETNDE